MYLWLLAVLTLCSDSEAQLTDPVRVSNGLMQGEYSINRTYISYSGIPYATAQRYGVPGPEPKWEATFIANKSVMCTHVNKLLRRTLGTEDCLVLNVYVPTTNTTNRSVMVFIHGGFFQSGSSSSFVYGPRQIVKHDVVLVTVNYRLANLGFLCLGTEEAPGNVGLRDQVRALEWVQKNIGQLGGNPNDVTLMGHSAGGASVSYHMISPMSQGLFHKIIIMSASSVAPWTVQYEPLDIARKFVQKLGVNATEPQDIYEALMKYSDVELVNNEVDRPEGDTYIGGVVFLPCIEKTIPGVEPFIKELPRLLFGKEQFQKVPVLIGHTDQEGYLFADLEDDDSLSKINFPVTLPDDLTFPNENVRNEIGAQVQDLYFDGKQPSQRNLKNLSNYEGDAFFTYPVISMADLLMRTSDQPVFAYNFSYVGTLNLVKLSTSFRFDEGATHGDDILYIFSIGLPLPMELIERSMIGKMSSMFTNFAKYTDPTPLTSKLIPIKWLPLNATNPQKLNIDKKITLEGLWDAPTMNFWRDMYEKYART